MVRRLAIFLLVALLALLLVPPLWWMGRDVWLLAGARDERARQEARWILQRDIARGSSRALEAGNLAAAPMPATDAGPTILPAKPRPDPLTQIATCEDQIFRVTAGDAATDADRPSFDPRRRILLDDAKFRLVSARIGTSQLVMLNACVHATPFAGPCARAFLAEEDRLTFRELIDQLVRQKALRVERRRYCWAYPEFRIARR